jgi:NAD(P)-dependent dehydrogenase (short-subunit alcohol dehydrogenase family)
VNPGPIATDQWFNSDEQFLKDMQPLIDSTPAAARVGEVSDIAPLVAFLCTDDAKWTTGACLSANGGLYN